MEEPNFSVIVAIIAAIRTAQIDGSKFAGMQTPRVRSEVADAIALARLICEMSKRQSS